MRVVSNPGLLSAMMLASTVVKGHPSNHHSRHHSKGGQANKPTLSASIVPGQYNTRDRAVPRSTAVNYDSVLVHSYPSQQAAVAEHAFDVTHDNHARSIPGQMQNVNYGSSYSAPSVADIKLLGAGTQSPAKEIISHVNAKVPDMASYLLSSASSILTNDFGMWNGSGTLPYTANTPTAPLTKNPYFSRDNGKGGYLNGKKLFIFADTETRLPDENWAFGGFVSSSVAVDAGDQAKYGKAPVMQDMMGVFENAQGLLRGFIPLTLGEIGYTDALTSKGERIAIWPQSSLIYFDSETALIYADLIHVNVNSPSLFTNIGNTLVKVTVPGQGGPEADRIVPEMFTGDEIRFGSVGGIRSWGAQGRGGNDGYVYLFANGDWGLYLARVAPEYLELKPAYEYYDATTKTWSYTAPTKSSAGHFFDGQISVVDIFYSPKHLTFIAVYQNVYIDNTVYWRALQPGPGGIKPAYAGGASSDMVAEMLHGAWSEQQVLLRLPTPENGQYSYAAGVNMGYFDDDDIVNGGGKMLLQWCEPLPKTDPKGYNTDFAVVEFD